MQTTKYDLIRLSEKIKDEIKDCGYELIELSRITKIDYFALRRFKMGTLKKVTTNVRDICKYFKINVDDYANSEFTIIQLHKVLKEVWDGTPGHAELIINLLESTKAFRIKIR